MDLYELPFAKIILLRDDIAEVIVNEGVQMDVGMVEQYHEFLRTHLRAPFSVLVNKINAYTYDFEAQQKLATIEEMTKIAVVIYNDISKRVAENLAVIPRPKTWNMQTFTDRDSALAWLVAEQEKHT